MSQEQETSTSLGPYTAPLIACAFAAITLGLITLVPGVLGYPDEAAKDALEAQAAQVSAVTEARNDQLREQIAALEGALEGGMCIADGKFSLPGRSLPNPVQAALPAAPPATTEACAEASTNPISVQALADRATVLVVKIDEGKSFSMGTGFFIRPGEVLTNAHVVDNKDAKVLIVSKGLGVVEASVVALGGSSNDGKIDLAVLSAPDAAGSSVEIFKFAGAERSDKIHSVGFPGHIVRRDPAFITSLTNPSSNPPSKEPVIDRGDIVMKQDEGKTGTWIYHSAYIDSGSSGGPLIDICGRVVGVNTASQIGPGSNKDDDRSFTNPIAKALALETVEAFFRDNGLQPPEISTVPAPKIGI